MPEKKVEAEKMEDYIKNLEESILQDRDLSDLSAEEQIEIIKEKSSEGDDSIVPEDDFFDRFAESKKEGKPLEIKFGIDPTGPDIHIGHAVSLLMLRRFQKMGHEVNLLIGDFTAQVGDPTGKNSEREAISKSQIASNMEQYLEQAGKVLDLGASNVQVLYNSQWLEKIPFSEWLQLSKKVNANQLAQRDYFKKRVESGQRVSLMEMSYPLLMGYDSVVMKPDVELGGADQLVNLHWCRELMSLYSEKPETFVTVDILPGVSGARDEDGKFKKMSKSLNNHIPLLDSPEEMYGKVMSIPDELMWLWFKNLTEIRANDLNQLRTLTETGNLHPKDVKRLLARLVVGSFNHNNRDIISMAEEAFDKKFGADKEVIPLDIEQVKVPKGKRLIDALSDISGESKGDLRKKVNGIYILKDGKYERISLEDLLSVQVENVAIIIKLGKRRFYEISGTDEKPSVEIVSETKDINAKLRDIIMSEPLIETQPSLEMIHDNIKEGGSIFYGTGVVTPHDMSVGLPFDTLGMILINEKIRRELALGNIYHHIADTHAKTNSWANPNEVDSMAHKVQETLLLVSKNLGLNNLKVVLSSSFDQTDEYKDLLRRFDSSDKHGYVKHELADMEWYRLKHGVVLKNGWIIQSKETTIGSDERLFDREYVKFMGSKNLSFIYTKAGRTFDSERPKVSPYIQIAGESRLLLDPEENVEKKISSLLKEGVDETYIQSTIKHLQRIVDLYEELFGSLGSLTSEEKLQIILDKCFGKV